MFKSGKHRDEKKSNYSQEDTDKSDKESLYGVLVFSHLNSTSDRFTSSLEPLLGNWIAKESYLGGKSSQFLIDLNSNCHSRREQFTIDRLPSKKSEFSKTSSNSSSWWHFIWIPLLFEKETFFKEANLRWKLFEYLRWVWEGRSERRKKFSDYWNSCLMPSLLLCVCCWNKLGRKRSSFHHHMLIPSCL